MKKILIVFLVLSVAACTFMLTASAADTHEQREATVVIPLHENIESGAIEFIYDESVLELVGGRWTLKNSLIDDFDVGNGRGVFALSTTGSVGGNIFTVKFKIKNTATVGENVTVDVSVKLMKHDGEILVENIKIDVCSGGESTSGGAGSTATQSSGTTASQTTGGSISTSVSTSASTSAQISTDTDGVDVKIFYICSIAVAAVAIVAVVLILTKKNH